MEIHDFDIASLSDLTYRIRVCPLGKAHEVSVVILAFTGTYGHGSGGNRDARFIDAIKAGALAALSPHGIVWDFREMGYEWGDRIMTVLRPTDECDRIPSALVVSDKCRAGFASCAAVVPPAFETLEEAIRHVEAGIQAGRDDAPRR